MQQNNEIIQSIVRRDGKLIYLENGDPIHAGIVEFDGNYYYAGKNGEIVTNQSHIVHSSMANGHVKHGTYKFDETGKLITETYKAPRAKTKHKSSRKRHNKKLRNTLVAAAAAAVALAVAAEITFTSIHSDSSKRSDSSSQTQETINLKKFSEPVYLCSDSMAEYYKGKKTLMDLVNARINPYQTFTFEYSASSDAQLELEDRTYTLSKNSTLITIDNLLANHRYDYKLTIGDEVRSGSFETADTNRFIYMEGAKNTRDIGGYRTESGKRIKQGMIIRGTELDGLVEKDYKLNSDEQTKYLKFKYDMDLRDPSINSGEYVSPLDKNVNHKFYNAAAYESVFEEDNYDTVKKIFEDLANPSNYPMYLHCTYGADRTGTVVYLLQGLLGAKNSDMVFEYELTGFMFQNYSNGILLNKTHDIISGFPGSTTAEKIEYFLVDKAGVSRENISKIKELLLEDDK